MPSQVFAFSPSQRNPKKLTPPLCNLPPLFFFVFFFLLLFLLKSNHEARPLPPFAMRTRRGGLETRQEETRPHTELLKRRWVPASNESPGKGSDANAFANNRNTSRKPPHQLSKLLVGPGHQRKPNQNRGPDNLSPPALYSL